jgi:hypothetical protein
MVFCTALLHGTRVGYITMTQKWKACHFNMVIPLLLERKISGLNHLFENACPQFPALQRHHSAGHDLRFLTPRLKWTSRSGCNNESFTFIKKKKKKNHCFFSMIKPDSTLVLNNADVNELYLVQISGLWGSSSLLQTNCSSSYIKTDGHCLRHYCKLVQKVSTVTFSSTHIARAINRQDQIKTKRKRRKIPSSCAKPAYQEMKA